MPMSTFTADITALHNAGYHSITLQQYLDWEAGKNPVLPSKPILLTDDDGDVSTMQMTSVLQSNSYTMVAFIVTGFIDNNDDFNVSWAQLQSMAASGTSEIALPIVRRDAVAVPRRHPDRSTARSIVRCASCPFTRPRTIHTAGDRASSMAGTAGRRISGIRASPRPRRRRPAAVYRRAASATANAPYGQHTAELSPCAE